MSKIDRRNFIRKSSEIVAGGFVANTLLQHIERSEQQQVTSKTKEESKPVLEYRTLGKTGMKVTAVGFGAMRTTDAAVLAQAVDLGINFVDTAHGYQGGNNERMVGEVLKGRRKDAFVCTKLKISSIENMKSDLETSLKRLQMDYVDVLYMHAARSIDVIQNEDYMKLYEQFKKEGKARFIGFSTHSNEATLLSQAAKDKFWDVILVAYNFQREEALTKAIKEATDAGIGIVAMKTQAGGYETKEMGNISPHQAALKWVLQNPNVHTTIPGILTFDELNEDFQVMNSKLGWNDRKTLYHYGKAIKGKYCTGCNACKDQCPYGVDIPELNRCYMYYEGYRDQEFARANFAEIKADFHASKCMLCDECSVTCVNGINLTERMRNINKLLA
ncbi:aldo/keto reductase [candidate division KSB1 bacterium]|nr:aldo/keto reductase [candidate division KSB1 bacterium]